MKMSDMTVLSIPRCSVEVYLQKQENTDVLFPCNLPLNIFKKWNNMKHSARMNEKEKKKTQLKF